MASLLAGRAAPQDTPAFDPWQWVLYRYPGTCHSISDGRDILYVGTDGGILRFSMFGRKWLEPSTIPQGLPDLPITAVHADLGTGLLWCATKRGVHVSTDSGGSWMTVDGQELGLRPGEAIIRFGSGEGRLWCQTTAQWMELHPVTGITLRTYAVPPTEGARWSSSRIVELPTVGRDPLEGFVPLGGWMREGNHLRDPAGRPVEVTTYHRDSFGDLWVGTGSGALLAGDRQMKTLEAIVFGPAFPHVSLVAREGRTIWIGSVGKEGQGSLARFIPDRGEWIRNSEGAEIPGKVGKPLGAVVVGNELWVACGGGAAVFEIAKERWRAVLQPPEGIGGSPKIASDGSSVYLGSDLGVWKRAVDAASGSGWERVLASGSRLILVLHHAQGRLLVSTADGVSIIEDSTARVRRVTSLMARESAGEAGGEFPLTGSSAVTSVASSGQKVYLGFLQGILEVNPSDLSARWVAGETRLLRAPPTAIEWYSEDSKDENGALWVLSSDGVRLVDLNDESDLFFPAPRSLPLLGSNSLVRTAEDLWIAHPAGLLRIDVRRAGQ